MALLKVLLQAMVCSVYLVLQFFGWLVKGPPRQPEPIAEPISQEKLLIQEEITALDSLVATLSRQEAELLEKAQLTTSVEKRHKLEAKAATIHLRLIRLNNKAVKLWEKEETL